MKKHSNTQVENWSVSTVREMNDPWGKEFPSHRGRYGISFLEERLFSLKAQAIIDELVQIARFVGELEKFWFESSGILDQIGSIISRLRSRDRDYRYTEIVHILAKYLCGVRDFSARTNAEGVLFYKRLFESTLVAIMREIDSLERAY